MDIGSLLSNSSGLMDQLKGLGLSDGNISGMADEIGNQLGGGDGFDFTDLLKGLQADNFLDQVNIASLAEKIGISPEIAEQAISLIAPKVAEFTGDSPLGGLGKLAGSLFGKK